MVSWALVMITFLIAFLPIRYVGLWKEEGQEWLKIWALLTAAAFLIPHFLGFTIAVWIGCAMLAKRMPGRVPTIYVLLLPLIPTYTYLLKGVPGINMLFTMDYTRALALFLLLPAWFAARSKQPRQSVGFNGVDLCFILYYAWAILVAALNIISVTDVLRQTFELLTFGLMPYLAIRRLLRKREQVLDMMSALIFTGLLVSCVCVTEIIFHRTLYTDLATRLRTEPLAGVGYIMQVRFGLLRVRGTLDGGLAVFAVFALGAVLCFAKMKKLSGGRLWTAILLLAIPIVFSGSRGTWIMTGIVLASWIGFRFIQTPLRFICTTLIVYTAAPAIQSYLLNTNDQFGTFNYRQRLLDTFFPVVWERPWFGWNTLRALYGTHRFDFLTQGEGMIDMVNTFLSEALLRGVPGFLFFSGIFLFGVIVPLRRLKQSSTAEAELIYPIVKWIACFLPALAFLLITTSLAAHIVAYMAVAAAVAGALGSMEIDPAPPVSLRKTPPSRLSMP